MIPKVRMIIVAMLFATFGAGSAFVSAMTAIGSNYILSGIAGIVIGASGAFVFYTVAMLCGREEKK